MEKSVIHTHAHTHASSRTKGIAIVPTRAITVATPEAVPSLLAFLWTQKRNPRFECVTMKATFNNDKQRVRQEHKQSQGQNKNKATQNELNTQLNQRMQVFFWHAQQIPHFNLQAISN